jgi:hypothetical protein
MLGLADATEKIVGDEFDPERAKLGEPAARIVLGFNEKVAKLVNNDLLDWDLVLHWLWMAGTWDRGGAVRTAVTPRTWPPRRASS